MGSQGGKESDKWDCSDSQSLPMLRFPDRYKLSSKILQNDDAFKLDILKFPR